MYLEGSEWPFVLFLVLEEISDQSDDLNRHVVYLRIWFIHLPNDFLEENFSHCIGFYCLAPGAW